jgi:hypothetical protein
MKTTIYTEDGTEIVPGSILAHETVAGLLSETYAKLDEIPYGLLEDETMTEERRVVEALRTSVSCLQAFHNAMTDNLKRYNGNVETSLTEARHWLEDAGKALRKRR